MHTLLKMKLWSLEQMHTIHLFRANACPTNRSNAYYAFRANDWLAFRASAGIPFYQCYKITDEFIGNANLELMFSHRFQDGAIFLAERGPGTGNEYMSKEVLNISEIPSIKYSPHASIKLQKVEKVHMSWKWQDAAIFKKKNGHFQIRSLWDLYGKD